MFKKLISGLLSFSLLTALFVPVSATSTASQGAAIDGLSISTSTMSTEYLAPSQSSPCDTFEISTPLNPDGIETYTSLSVKDSLLAYCTPLNSEVLCGNDVTEYSFDESKLSLLLVDCASIQEIYTFNDILNVEYTTADGDTVTLCYNDSGWFSTFVYSAKNDVGYYKDQSTLVEYDALRQANSFTLSDELVDKIYDGIAEGDYSLIDEIEEAVGMPIYEDRNSVAPRSSSPTGFQNEQAMTADLKRDFPYVDRRLNYTTKTGNGNISVTAHVREIREDYVKKSADWKSFAANTAISVIGIALAVPELAVIDILSAIGVAVSTAKQIKTAVTLYRSAKFTYSFQRHGYAWDKWKEANVHVIWNSSRGEFAGGYTSSGAFTWIISETPSTASVSYSSIIDKTVANFSTEVMIYGINTRYFPD